MNKTKIITALVLFTAFTGLATAQTNILYEEDFETGNWNDWTGSADICTTTYEGQYSGCSYDNSNSPYTGINNIEADKIQVALRGEGFTSSYHRSTLRISNQNNNEIITISLGSDGKGGTFVNSETYESTSTTSVWYNFILEDIDYTNNEIGSITVMKDGSELSTSNNIAFKTNADSIGQLQYTPDGAYSDTYNYIDNIELSEVQQDESPIIEDTEVVIDDSTAPNSYQAFANVSNVKSNDSEYVEVYSENDSEMILNQTLVSDTSRDGFNYAMITNQQLNRIKQNLRFEFNVYDNSTDQTIQTNTTKYIENTVNVDNNLPNDFNGTELTGGRFYGNWSSEWNNWHQFERGHSLIIDIDWKETGASGYSDLKQFEYSNFNGTDYVTQGSFEGGFEIDNLGLGTEFFNIENMTLKTEFRYFNESTDEVFISETFETQHSTNTAESSLIDSLISGFSNLFEGITSLLTDILQFIFDALEELILFLIDLVIGFLTILIDILVSIIGYIFVILGNLTQYLMFNITDLDWQYDNQTYDYLNQTDSNTLDVLSGNITSTVNERQDSYLDSAWGVNGKTLVTYNNEIKIFDYELYSSVFDRSGDQPVWLSNTYNDNFSTDNNTGLYSCIGDNPLNYDSTNEYISCTSGNAKIVGTGFYGTDKSVQKTNISIQAFSDEDNEFSDFSYSLESFSDKYSTSVSSTRNTDNIPTYLQVANERINTTHMWSNVSFYYEGFEENLDVENTQVVQYEVNQSDIGFQINFSGETVSEDEEIRITNVSSDYVLDREFTSGTVYEPDSLSITLPIPKEFDPKGLPYGSSGTVNLAIGLFGFVVDVIPEPIYEVASTFIVTANSFVEFVVSVVLWTTGGINWIVNDGAEYIYYGALAGGGFKLLHYWEKIDNSNMSSSEAFNYIFNDIMNMFDTGLKIVVESYRMLTDMFELMIHIINTVRGIIRGV